ncbi:hypothetical protein OGATHE_004487 [Ogataea polymorpha]|uniref:Secreted protein n=1 Tax=Ogataea polymorpha TaxID=460523 RepID=A0A9P8T1U1_9ASCO|nr:hypothetical protein OGATHE_004487 [Ogataea polymorpha]
MMIKNWSLVFLSRLMLSQFSTITESTELLNFFKRISNFKWSEVKFWRKIDIVHKIPLWKQAWTLLAKGVSRPLKNRLKFWCDLLAP